MSSRLAAESEGKDSGRDENSDCVKASQTPTPNKPHPPNQKMRLKTNMRYFTQQRQPRETDILDLDGDR